MDTLVCRINKGWGGEDGECLDEAGCDITC